MREDTTDAIIGGAVDNEISGADAERKKRRSISGVYTTGEAAAVAKVSQQTIIRWIDAGLLKGYRVPGSSHRRIVREVLEQFLRNNNMTIDPGCADTGDDYVI
ncbi:MAG: response regulator receiver protein [Candidatus Peregrinibacteria bacterium Gr01-1014_25]|nr:MAG: response regulator receiver protein [Candidatus Peregrinibacteria bacterium Gr01-1014_25]